MSILFADRIFGAPAAVAAAGPGFILGDPGVFIFFIKNYLF